MKAFIFGATGMVGQGVLRECLIDDEISSLLTAGRTTTGIASPKLIKTQQSDLLDYGEIESRLAGFDACLFCLGISSLGPNKADHAPAMAPLIPRTKGRRSAGPKPASEAGAIENALPNGTRVNACEGEEVALAAEEGGDVSSLLQKHRGDQTKPRSFVRVKCRRLV